MTWQYRVRVTWVDNRRHVGGTIDWEGGETTPVARDPVVIVSADEYLSS